MSRDIRLIVSVDTEEDNWGPSDQRLSAGNVNEIPRFHALCERLGLRTTYFTTYQVAARPSVAAILRELGASGRVELAAHLHPWSTPPYATSGNEPSMLNRYPPEIQLAKLRTLTDMHGEAFGARPVSFRAGRFGLGMATVQCLIQSGYRVDSSVTPLLSWEAFDGGPDFLGAPYSAYHLDGRGDVRRPVTDGALMEVPLSVGFTRFGAQHWDRMATLMRQPAARGLFLPSLGARTGIVRRAILSPETNSVAEMLAVSERLVASGASHLHVFFHSSTLRPGLTPFVRSRSDLDRFYTRIERFVEGLAQIGRVVPATVGEVAAQVETDGPSGLGRPGSVHSVRRRARPRRVLIINYHFPPDGSVGGLRWAGFSKYLVRAGWDVHILVATGASRIWEGVQVHAVERLATLNDLHRWLAPKVRRWVSRGGGRADAVVNAGGLPARFGWRWLRRELASLLSFPDESRGWMLRAAWRARRLFNAFEPDVVVSSGPPHTAHMAAALALTGKDRPLIVDLRDPWSTRMGAWRYDPVFGTDIARFMAPRLERWVFGAAREVIANTRELADTTASDNPDLRVSWLRNGVDLEQLPARGGTPFPGLSLLHAGTLYGGRDLSSVLVALRTLCDRHPELEHDGSRLRIAGHMESGRSETLAAKVAHYRLAPLVEVLGIVPRGEALDLLRRSAISLVLAQNQDLAVPAKLYESLAIGRVTLVLAEQGSAAAREGEMLGAEVRSPDDVPGIVDLFERVWQTRSDQAAQPVEAVDYARLADQLQVILANRVRAELPHVREILRGASAVRGDGIPRENWVWLATPSGWERAVELVRRGDAPRFASGMRAHFRRVDTHAVPEEVTGIPRPVTFPYEDRELDCIATFDAWSRESRVDGTLEPSAHRPWMLRECRRVLRPGGCLFVATDNSRWYRTLTQRRRFPAPLKYAQLLRESGFRDVRVFFVTPGADLPEGVIPATVASIRAYERFTSDRSWRAWIRQALAYLGAGQLLYPSLYVLAYK